jgi:hypothetical protein
MGNPTRYGRLSVLVGDGVTTGEVYWSAVFAGVIVTLVGQLLWTLLGTGIGAGVIDPATADGEKVAWGAYAYWAVTGIASAAAGGWTAGWIAGSSPRTDRIEGGFQGFLSWALATLILAVVILGMAGGSLGVAASLGGPLAANARAVADAQPQDVAAASAAAAALWAFFALVLGAIASMGAAYLGVGHANVPASTTARKATSTRATA